VTATAKVNTSNSCDYGSYALNFGDGTAPISLLVPAGTCAPVEQIVPHTYNVPGEYSISLRVGTNHSTVKVTVGGTGSTGTTGGAATGFSACMASGGVVSGASPRVCSIGGVSYIESSVTGNTFLDTLSPNTTTGIAPIDVLFTTRINSRSACGGGEYTIDFGDGQRAPLTYSTACAPTNSTVTHRYSTAGTFTVRLYAVSSANTASATPVATTNIVVSSSSSSGSSFNPQFAVSPGYEGIFQRVRATFQLPDTCTGFTLNWGDNSTVAARAQGSGCANAVDPQTMTHTYPSNTSSATYTITLTYGPTGSQTSRSASVVIVGSY
jgi:hypothetical protein